MYNTKTRYLNKWYNSENNVFQNFAVFNLKAKDFNFNDLKATNSLNTEINEDALFDEVHSIEFKV